MESLRSAYLFDLNKLASLIFRIYYPKEGIHHGRFQFQLISEYWSTGVLEYWSVGVMVKGLMVFLSKLQYSITPMLQGRDFQKLLTTLNLPFYWS